MPSTPRRPRRRARRIEELEAYVRACATTLQLGQWLIVVDPAPAPVGCAAQILDEDPRTARLWVARIFWRSTPEYQRQVIVHELTHLAGTALNAPIEQIEAALVPQVATALKTSIHSAEHAIIAWLEPLLAQIVPLPPTFSPPRSR